MYIAVLGRQPALGMAELESVYGQTSWFGADAALIDADDIDLSRLGGSQKIGEVVLRLSFSSWSDLSTKVVRHYVDKWQTETGKITLGLSTYGFDGLPPSEVQKLGLKIKQALKGRSGSLRLIPNQTSALSTATSHHNKLGLSAGKVELLIIASGKEVVVAESIGAQNITAYAQRDQARPRRDAFVGMLPPKLAQIMLNLAVGSAKQPLTILDPFCGTGVILQEAALAGHSVYGSDLSEKMVHYTRDNLNWLAEKLSAPVDWYLHPGDATTASWRQPIDAVVAETYLGQPFSAPPSEAKLAEVQATCEHIVSDFLRNIGQQVPAGTPFCLAVPAWRRPDGSFTHLPVVDTLGRLGYRPREFKNVSKNDLMYYRADQVVARELLIFSKA